MAPLWRAPTQPQVGLAHATAGAGGGGEAAAELRLSQQPAGAGGADLPRPAAGAPPGAGLACRAARRRVLDRSTPTAPALRHLALEASAQGVDAGAMALERVAVRPGELAVCAGESVAVARSPGPPAQRSPQSVLGLVVAADSAGVPAGGAPLVFLLPVHGVG